MIMPVQKNKLKIFLLQMALFLFCSSAFTIGQIKNVDAGFSVGLGEIKGNSSAVSSFGFSLFADIIPWFADDLIIRAGFLHARKVEYFLPENRMGRYYPFINSFSLSGLFKFKLKNPFFIEQGAGVILLNDRTFADINQWESGVCFSLLSGIEFDRENRKNFILGLSFDYGLTFTSTNASYFIISLNTRYKF